MDWPDYMAPQQPVTDEESGVPGEQQWPPTSWVTPPEETTIPPWEQRHEVPVEAAAQEEEWPPRAWITPDEENVAPPVQQATDGLGGEWPPKEWQAPDVAPTPGSLERAGVLGNQTMAPDLEEGRGEAAVAHEMSRLESMTPEERAAEAAQKEVERQQFASERRQEALANYEQEIADNLAAQKKAAANVQAKLADLEAKWAEHGKQSIDTGRWWSNASTGTKLAAYAGAAIHGFLNPGGPNQTIQAMQTAIDRDIAAQRADIETGRASLNAQQNLVAQYAQITGDLVTGSLAASAAAWRVQGARIDEEAAQFDPFGTQARNAYDAKARVVAEQQKAEAALAEQMAKSASEAAEQARKDREEERKMAELAQRQLEAKQQHQRYYSGLRQQKREHEDDVSYKLDELEERRAERREKQRLEADTDTRERGVWEIKSKDGSVWKAPTPKAAEDVNKTIGGVQEAADVIEQLIKLRRTHGAEWSALNSEARQEMQNLHKNLMLKIKNAEDLGAISGADMDLINGLIGDDPAGLYSNITTLATQRQQMVDKVNTKLRSQYGYRGDAWQPENVTTYEAPLTENEKAEKLFGANLGDLGEERSDAASQALGAVTGVQNVPVKKKHLRAIAGTEAVVGEAKERVLDTQKYELRKVRGRAMELGKRQEELDKLVASGASEKKLRKAKAAVDDAAEAVNVIRRVRAQKTPIGEWAKQATKDMFEVNVDEGEDDE